MSEDLSYDEQVLAGVETRVHLDTVLHRRYKRIKRLATAALGIDANEFKSAMDTIYYNGGYPSPTSPPRVEVLADKVANTLRVFDGLGDDRLVELLAQRGITVAITPERSYRGTHVHDGLMPWLTTGWKKAELEGEPPQDRTELLRILTEACQDLQAEICHEADTIKIGRAEDVEDRLGVLKPNYMKAVQLGAVKQRKGSVKMGPLREKVLDLADGLPPALEPLNLIEEPS